MTDANDNTRYKTWRSGHDAELHVNERAKSRS